VTGTDDRGPGGALYVVATPIGNLADGSQRALEVLREVPLIAAADTRHSMRLLARHGIETRLTSFHARSGPGRLTALLEHLRGGHDLALVSDAGTPIVSDPGADLVGAWADEGGRVVPIPGPSAVMAAVSATGMAGPRWSFEGFLPRSGRERRDRLAAIAADERGSAGAGLGGRGGEGGENGGGSGAGGGTGWRELRCVATDLQLSCDVNLLTVNCNAGDVTLAMEAGCRSCSSGQSYCQFAPGPPYCPMPGAPCCRQCCCPP
jgi:hypothetical protein